MTASEFDCVSVSTDDFCARDIRLTRLNGVDKDKIVFWAISGNDSDRVEMVWGSWVQGFILVTVSPTRIVPDWTILAFAPRLRCRMASGPLTNLRASCPNRDANLAQPV